MTDRMTAAEMALNGYSLAEIAAALGKSYSWASKNTPKMKRGPGKARVDEDRRTRKQRADAWIERLDAGETLQQIADGEEITRERVRQIVSEFDHVPKFDRSRNRAKKKRDRLIPDAEKLWRQGLSRPEIAIRLGVSVRHVIVKLLPDKTAEECRLRNKKTRSANNSLDRPCYDARREGLTWQQVGERFGLSGASARNRALRHSGGVDPLGRTRAPGEKRRRRA